VSRVCAHCGKVFEGEPLVCPHCGADADLTYAEPPPEHEFEEDEEAAYRETLEAEGLSGKAPKGCAAVLLLVLALGWACV
jgi:hypothetical protein